MIRDAVERERGLPLYSRPTVPRQIFIDDFAHFTRRKRRLRASPTRPRGELEKLGKVRANKGVSPGGKQTVRPSGPLSVGENFSIFNEKVLALLEAVPGLRGDPDVNATKEGVTFLWLK
jgi:hypothetical protein